MRSKLKSTGVIIRSMDWRARLKPTINIPSAIMEEAIYSALAWPKGCSLSAGLLE